MKRTTILNLSKFNFLTTVRENTSLIAFSALFVFSLLSGCLFTKFVKFFNVAERICSYYFSNQISVGFYSVFIFFFLLSLAFIFISFVFGTSIIGIAFVPAVVAVRGFLTGLLLGRIYCVYGFNAIAYNLLIFIPSTTISVLALIAASSFSIKLSYSLGKLLLTNGKNIKIQFSKNVVIFFIVILLISAVSALINALLSAAFLKYFSLG